MNRVGHSLLLGAFLAFSTGSAFSADHAGQIGWDADITQLAEVQCGFSADDFIMVARSEGVRLRLAFRGAGTEESVDFADVSSVDLSFVNDHELSGQQFRMSRSLGEMGEIAASHDHATGQLHLRPASVQALDAQPDGLTVAYDFRCTAELF